MISPPRDGHWSVRRSCLKRRVQACSPWATSGAATSSVWHRPSVRARSLSHSSIAFWPIRSTKHLACRRCRLIGDSTEGVMFDSAVAPVFNVVAFAGSLRRGSYNRALLRETKELAPPVLHIVIHELDAIPLYNADIDAAGAPSSVVQLRDAVRQS